MPESIENYKKYLAWYLEKVEAPGIFARFFGKKEEFRQKAEKLRTVIETLEALPPRKQELILNAIVLFTARIRGETEGNVVLRVEELDELIEFIAQMASKR